MDPNTPLMLDSFDLIEMYRKTVIGVIILLISLFSLYFVYYLKSDAGYAGFPFHSDPLNNVSRTKWTVTPLAQLESDFQDYLQSIQEPRNCSEVEVLRCGLIETCGFACQIHHRIACAVFSSVIGMPWMHDENHKWPYKDPWTSYLKPVGTKCKGVRGVRWVERWEDYSSYTANGFPVPNYFVQRLKGLHQKPFLWFVGQFTKFVFQITPEMEATIQRLKVKLGMTSGPTMGLHVRRSDKLKEARYVKNEDYFREIYGYRNKINSDEKLTVLVTSDDHTVLPLFKRHFQRHPSIRIVGFVSNVTAQAPGERWPYLFSIVRDIMLLAECDFVVCTYSSNVCRLILEIRIGRGLPESSVKSLDWAYYFIVTQTIYRHRDDIGTFSLLSSLNDHFGGVLGQPLRLPQHVKEKIEVEPLQNENLPKFDPSAPIILESEDDIERPYQLVIGYRELFLKRERILFLTLLTDLNLGDSFKETLAPGGGAPKNSANNPKSGGQQSQKNGRDTGGQAQKVSDFPVVKPWKDKCELEQIIEEPKADFEDVYAVRQERQKAIDKGKVIVRQMSLGSHYMFLYRGRQLDSEWLQLSASTDPEVEMEKEKRLRLMSFHEPWMDTGLNFASQKLFKALRIMNLMTTLTGQNPFVWQPSYRNKILMVHVFRKRMFFYCISTLSLWGIFCFIVTNILDLKYQTDPSDVYKNIEYSEMCLYYIPLMAFVINLFLASLWSLLVLLHYSLVIANYYNLWSKSMPLLLVNPAFGISSYVQVHYSCYAIYVLLNILSFYHNWPLVTRATCGQIFVLTTRQMLPQVRLLPPEDFMLGQIAALAVYMYCVWVNRALYMLMHTFSLMLRNACYQWNLNFALRFQLIPTFYRAHLMRVATQASLLRLYNQHRLIAALCEYFGKTFLQPLFVYGGINIAVVTVIMIYFIKYEELDPATFHHKFTLDLKDALGSDSKAEIYHTLPKQHEVIAVFFVMIQCTVDFIQGTIGLGWGAAAISGSFEFVRRHGLLQCNTRHERRLIHSLQMSFADVRAPLMTAQRYFGITRRNVFIGMMTMAFFWTMIIQCQVEQPSALIEWVSSTDERCAGLREYEDVLGGKYCLIGHKFRMRIKQRLQRNRNQYIKKRLNRHVDTKTKYWFFEDCDREDIAYEDTPEIKMVKFGICQIKFSQTEQSEKWSNRYPRNLMPEGYAEYETRWEKSMTAWAPQSYSIRSKYPCDFTSAVKWKDYYRDFFRPCYSPRLNKHVVHPVLFHRDTGKPYALKTDGDNVDCGINQFTQEDIKGLVGCSGKVTALDDCGSARAPDFVINSNKAPGLFLHEPPLKFFTFPIDLPHNYLQAGFPEAGVLRCWDTFAAKQKCIAPEMRKYCRIGKLRGRTDLIGYLYGKDCWDYQHFAEFVPPNHYLFCQHPRPENIEDRPMWIDEGTYKDNMKERPEPTTEKPIVPPEETPATAASPAKKRRSIVRKASEALGQSTSRPKSNIDQVYLRGFNKKKKSTKKPSGRKALGRNAMARSVKKPNNQARNVMYKEGNKVSRKTIFSKFFPCTTAENEVIGWLPLPHVAKKGDDKTTMISEAELKSARAGNDSCWDDPYPDAAFPSDLATVTDALGRKFLDDCLSPWWEDDVDHFIPDDVFDPSNKLLMQENGYKCWETSKALVKCGHEKAKCFNLH